MDAAERIVADALDGMPNHRPLDHRAFHARLRLELGKDESSYRELVDAIALHLARRFVDGSVDYWDADDIANALWGFMVLEAPERPLPEVGQAVFEAFDAGEWDRRDGSDPVATQTAPMIEAILRSQG